MQTLSTDDLRTRITDRLDQSEFEGQRVLLIVPDATRTAPLPFLFEAVHQELSSVVAKLDVLIALGTHPAMTEDQINQLMGITEEDRSSRLADVGFFNHEWDNQDRLIQIGEFTRADVEEISDGLMSLDVPVKVNARIKDYDTLLVLGPVFPHEVAGFSGGSKYFFPGISGPELLNFFHWLGALITNVGIIGVKDTPVRRVVNRAAAMIPNQRRCLAFVVDSQANIYDIFYGTPEAAWEQAADLSSQIHISRVAKPFKQVLSCAPPMYDELWVAGKCMYKLEPVVADDGELIIYAPHMKDISITHGDVIAEVGYHVRDYFTKQWDKFKHYPWGVLAHSTHVRGSGTFEDGIEKPRVQVTLASQIPPDVCARINLGYKDPATIDVESYANQEDEGILLIRKAGEQLYRLDDE
jgi:nickel-dependent lactate racemase